MSSRTTIGRKIAVSGVSGSGKSTVSSYLNQNQNFEVLHPGSVVRKIAQLIFGEVSKPKLYLVDNALREVDNDIWIKAAIRNRGPIPDDCNIVVDGVRYYSNYVFLKEMGFEFWLIEASDTIIKERSPKLPTEQINFEAGENDFKRIPFSSHIKNNGSKVELHTEVSRLLFSASHTVLPQ